MDDIKLIVDDINNTTSTVRISLDKKQISKFVGRNSPYRNLPRKFVPALEQVGDYVRTTMIPEVFAAEGPGWAPLAPMTVQDRITRGFKGKHPILIRTRDLYQELTEKSHPKHVEIIRSGKYARIEIGGSSEKFIQNQLGKGVPGQRLPRRAMIPGTGNLPIRDRDRARIKEILLKAIEK